MNQLLLPLGRIAGFVGFFICLASGLARLAGVYGIIGFEMLTLLQAGIGGMVGAGIGGISAMVAIGGGSLSVPFMTWCNVKMQHAIGTSAAIGLPIAVAGALGYLINGWGAPGLPEFTVGFIYLPALVLVSAMSSLTAPIGARLAHRLPVAVLKKVFAGVLIVLSAKMLHTLMAG